MAEGYVQCVISGYICKYEKFEKIMYILLLVAWCGGVACGAENKEMRNEVGGCQREL